MKNSQIGKSNSKSAIRNQASLKYAMEEAQRFISKSPVSPISPVKLPKSPSTTILRILKDEEKDFSRPETPYIIFAPELGSETQVKYWVGNKVISFFFMIFKASLLIQITDINKFSFESNVFPFKWV